MIVIPAFNEESTVKEVVSSVPRKIPGSSSVHVLLVDDGSSDNTAREALEGGADKIIRHSRNMGVAAAIKHGIQCALQMGADVICMIDSDGQFLPSEIPLVVAPIVDGTADIVIGSRFSSSRVPRGISYIRHLGNKIIARIMRALTMRSLSDAETGFRAISRPAALGLRLIGYFTFTHDMLLDVAARGLRMKEVPVRVTYLPHRQSRAVKNTFYYSLSFLSIVLLKSIQLFFRSLTGELSHARRRG
ncbi:MAG: glycosyltransferase family 2 protein [Candidatus Thorarchaeota archaeon]|nr:glycosyltransferase family 2 protein [Candidatus Thorarchaeota archaeon]